MVVGVQVAGKGAGGGGGGRGRVAWSRYMYYAFCYEWEKGNGDVDRTKARRGAAALIRLKSKYIVRFCGFSIDATFTTYPVDKVGSSVDAL